MDRMKTLFVGHGSPMNAIENNRFTRAWKQTADSLPKPKAILCVSAHWFTNGTKVNDTENPKTIYDMYGFPDELYKIVYDAKGAPEVAHKTASLLNNTDIDNSWGTDHGAWSVLHHMYNDRDVQLFQLSIDKNLAPQDYFDMGKKLAPLRDEGVLIVGSGNVVHNLSRIGWDVDGGYAWADEFDTYIKENIQKGNIDDVINFKKAGKSAELSFRTIEHFAPLLFVAGAADDISAATVFNDECVLGSLSMTSYLSN